jgi:hypothetical protein
LEPCGRLTEVVRDEIQGLLVVRDLRVQASEIEPV